LSEIPLIVAARRTPIATRGRAFADVPAHVLAGRVLEATLADAREACGGELPVADVLLGNCMGPGGNTARLSALEAGLGAAVPGMTVDRQCGSGLAAIVAAAEAIAAGDPRPRLAGGVESPSTQPQRLANGVGYSRAPFTPTGWPDPEMPRAAEALASVRSISRERQDAHARRSHERALEAAGAGRFDREIVGLGRAVRDDSPGRGLRLIDRALPLFNAGTVTAATSTRISDGAAAVCVVPAVPHRRITGLALRSHAVVGVDPALPGLGAAPAISAALAGADVSLERIAAFEIVEAFASQSLAVLGELGLEDDDARVCADGGALALGHPWGASGAVAMVRLFSRLVAAGAPAGTLGVAACSVGGGMGIAALVEVVR
jgi:acetyl-CoA C-acetyltransferase